MSLRSRVLRFQFIPPSLHFYSHCSPLIIAFALLHTTALGRPPLIKSPWFKQLPSNEVMVNEVKGIPYWPLLLLSIIEIFLHALSLPEPGFPGPKGFSFANHRCLISVLVGVTPRHLFSFLLLTFQPEHVPLGPSTPASLIRHYAGSCNGIRRRNCGGYTLVFLLQLIISVSFVRKRLLFFFFIIEDQII